MAARSMLGCVSSPFARSRAPRAFSRIGRRSLTAALAMERNLSCCSAVASSSIAACRTTRSTRSSISVPAAQLALTG